jgi:predicted RNA-binding Zn ribbon-like protein
MGLMTFPGRRWVWYGGRPSLDFVNTRRNREAGRADEVAEYLRGPDDLAAWLRAAGLCPAGPDGAGPGGAGPGGAGPDGADPDGADPDGGSPAVDEESFAGALALREALSALVTASVAGDSAPAAAVRCVNQWLALPPERPVLRLEAGVPVLGPAPAARTPRGVLAMIAADAAELLGTDLRERLRICPGPGCRGRFLDDSPAGRRRWCSMAVCGNRSKAAAHRQAAHAAPGPS